MAGARWQAFYDVISLMIFLRGVYLVSFMSLLRLFA